MDQEMLIAIGIIFVLVVIMGITTQRNQKKSKIRMLKEAWGKLANNEYTDEDYKKIEYYFRNHEKSGVYIDDITFNDLSLDVLYEKMNTTSSSIGNEYLYNMLRETATSVKELKKRDKIMKFFGKNEEARLEFQKIFMNVGNFSKISIYEYILRVKESEERGIIKHIIQDLAMLISFVLVLKGVTWAIGTFMLMIVVNIATYYKEKKFLDAWFDLIMYLIRAERNVKNIIKTIEKYKIVELEEEKEKLEKIDKTLKKLKKNSYLIGNTGGGLGDFAGVVLDYFKVLTHVDLMKFGRVITLIKEHQYDVMEMYEILGYIDSLQAVASFRETLSEWSEPEIEKTMDIRYEVEDIYHPLIKEPVKNSLKENGAVLLTGSNASGKSTFIKTLAINALLSQTIYTSTSKHYKGCFFNIYSSMALKDDLFSNESYYIVEIKSLKRIIDLENKEYPTLCFVDEVLRGTNTLERIAASSQILVKLAKKGAMSFAATHDIELTHILGKYYKNYHFQEEVIDDDVVFDYKLYEGPATSKNAIKLLNMIGYDKEITKNAEEIANKFLENGVWDNIM